MMIPGSVCLPQLGSEFLAASEATASSCAAGSPKEVCRVRNRRRRSTAQYWPPRIREPTARFGARFRSVERDEKPALGHDERFFRIQHFLGKLGGFWLRGAFFFLAIGPSVLSSSRSGANAQGAPSALREDEGEIEIPCISDPDPEVDQSRASLGLQLYDGEPDE